MQTLTSKAENAVLTENQKREFQENGVLVIPDVIPPDLCALVVDTIIKFAEVDLKNEKTWYQERFAGHGIVPLHHAQPLWDVRQHPNVHQAFAELYDNPNLWVSMDRASYKPPANETTSRWQREPMHWDCDPWSYRGTSFQALMYLSDTDEDQGAFCCAPAVYRNLDKYLEAHQHDQNRRFPKIPASDIIPYGGKAGSLVVFHRLMPHSSLPNTSGKHRFVQYVTMQPAPSAETLRAEQISLWQNKMPPDWAIAQNIQEQDIPAPGPPAVLTELGKKLVGIAAW